MVSAQGGGPDALPVARHQHVITAPVAGPLSTLEAYGVGVAAWRLGAGRAHKRTRSSTALVSSCTPSQGMLSEGQPIANLLADDEAAYRPPSLVEGHGIGGEPMDRHPLVITRFDENTRGRGLCEIIVPARIPVPGGKTIEEFVGRASSGDTGVSVAHMVAPAGWDEPFQAPTFDEFTVVLEGNSSLTTVMRPLRWLPAKAIITRAGERIRYRTDSGARYVASASRPSPPRTPTATVS